MVIEVKMGRTAMEKYLVKREYIQIVLSDTKIKETVQDDVMKYRRRKINNIRKIIKGSLRLGTAKCLCCKRACNYIKYLGGWKKRVKFGEGKWQIWGILANPP